MSCPILSSLMIRLWSLLCGLTLGWFSLGNNVAIAAVVPPLNQIQVTTTADAGEGSLRWAIAQANAALDDNLIDLSQVQGEITLASPLPAITSNLILVGDGDDVISGDGRYRVLQVKGGHVTIRDVTLANGLAKGENGINGGGGSAGMGGGLLIRSGTVKLVRTRFFDNQAVGGGGSQRLSSSKLSQPPLQIQSQNNRLRVNRGAIVGVDGISALSTDALDNVSAEISRTKEHLKANRGAIAGVSGIGINGIGTIAFGGGGGFGGFGNAGNGGNGGNGGTEGGSGGNGGDGGNGGVGIFGSFGQWEDQGGIGSVTFGGGGGFGGFGNAGNGGNGANATVAISNGGDGGNGGNGGFGGGGGAGGFGGMGGSNSNSGDLGLPGNGGFGGGDGEVGYGGSGGGFGGAIFVRSGSLLLYQTSFKRNVALSGTGVSPGQGKGGAIFILPSLLSEIQSNLSEPTVLVLGNPPKFTDNMASDATGLPTDNNNVFGTLLGKSASASKID